MSNNFASIQEACENLPSSKESEIEFLSWFNGAKSVDESISSGYTDMMYRILTSDLLEKIGDPSQENCCEIGFGSGRLLLPATFIFKHAYGIDIHQEFDRVSKRIKKYNRDNFSLVHSKDSNSVIPDNSIKFFYSFITFQHFENWEVAESYLNLIEKKMCSGGYGIIFFGHYPYEDVDFYVQNHQTYDDFPMTLYVSKSFAKKELSKRFEVLELGVTTKRPWLSNPSRQFYVKIKKR
jgi:hypothetical protein